MPKNNKKGRRYSREFKDSILQGTIYQWIKNSKKQQEKENHQPM